MPYNVLMTNLFTDEGKPYLNNLINYTNLAGFVVNCYQYVSRAQHFERIYLNFADWK